MKSFLNLILFSLIAKADLNVLLNKWPELHGGVPPFDKIKISDFKPALEKAMDMQRKEIQSIINNSELPNFENTIAALDRSRDELLKISALFGVWGSSLSTPEFQAVEEQMAPILAGFKDEIIQNKELFKRIEMVAKSVKNNSGKNLTTEQKRLIWYTEAYFTLNGARLNESDKKRVTTINQKLSTLYTQFSQNQLVDEEGDFLTLGCKALKAKMALPFIGRAIFHLKA